MLAASAIVLGLWSAGGCAPAGGSGVDARVAVDAGPLAADGSTPRDAAPGSDAPGSDASATDDAGADDAGRALDAAAIDAASTTDAAAPDGGASSAHPHEPPGFVRILENACDAFPPVMGRATVGDPGVLAGFWQMSSTTRTATMDPTAPFSAPGTWEWTYRSGCWGGTAPLTLEGRELATIAPEHDALYFSVWLRFGDATGWEGHHTSTKLLFIRVGGLPPNGAGSLIPIIAGDGCVPSANGCGPSQCALSTRPTYRAEMHYENRDMPAGLTSRAMRTTSGPPRPLLAGVWQHHEMLVRVSDVDATNGEVSWWIDGTLVMHHTDVYLRDSSTAQTHALWGQMHLSPTWGGGPAARTRPDRMAWDHVYVSAGP